MEGVDENGTKYTPLQMTWASPLSEVYTTDKVSYVKFHLKEEEITLLSPQAMC